MPLDLDYLRLALGPGHPIEYHDEIGSTNDRAMSLAREGAPAGTVVTADFQTAGRGRRGASWFAPAGTGVLASLILRPRVALPPSHLAILSGVGVAEASRSRQNDRNRTDF
jgi:BirA family biotin operon repressor/biotin-[acetyl-CoA-carboxylase] ligase